MKRSDVAMDFGDSPQHIQNNYNNNSHNNNHIGSSANHVVYQKSNNFGSRGGEDWNRNKNAAKEQPVTMSSWLEQGDTPAGSVYVQEEIRPGVVLEGYAIEI